MVEIGPGTGALTKYLTKIDCALELMEVDTESITYLNKYYPDITVHHQDFLKANLDDFFDDQVAVVGNFPYNISSQIIFKVLDFKHKIPEVVGMFQKEVAERICEPPGNKTYGILSVLVQAFYEAEYLFTVNEDVFDPPPKVKSGVLRLKRKTNQTLDCDPKKFKQVVKAGFNQRRKTLRNSLKQFGVIDKVDPEILAKRPEQLSWETFVEITNAISK